MLKKHQNKLLELVRETNLDLQKFSTQNEVVSNYPAFRIKVVSDQLYFLLWSNIVDESYHYRYEYTSYQRKFPESAFYVNKSYGFSDSKWLSFESVEKSFGEWLEKNAAKYINHLHEEEEDALLPNLWAQLEESSNHLINASASENTIFTIEEQQQITEKLKNFEQTIHNQNLLTAEQTELLSERLDYLVESSKRLGRKDWINISIGALLGYTLQVGLTPEVAKQIIVLAGEAISWISNFPAPPNLLL